jgi:hypothetical protein
MVTVERLVKETDLAWALAEAAKPHLSTVELQSVLVRRSERFANYSNRLP